MESKIYCPLTKSECYKKSCIWYVEHQETCAVILISEDLREIAEKLEEESDAD